MVPEFVSRFERAYLSGAQLPWELDGPAEFVVRLAEEGVFRGPVLDAGCGTGENALFLAGRGYEVVGVDAAPTALARARAKAEERGVDVEWSADDVRELPGRRDFFGTVLDSGLFHNLDESDQRRYADTLYRACRSGADVYLFAMNNNPLNFAEPHRWSPSCDRHGVRLSAIEQAFAGDWNVAAIDETRMTVFVPHQGDRVRYFWLARLHKG
ncbi:class I SAM-dependent methyltransferase [Nocardia sp. NPDC020380]|uniref:class I SAM-dependent methyltransferase n=1 Tax=Nocardia sp. NPDC020380 TaxID=3364309 RepID=UPI0037913FEB